VKWENGGRGEKGQPALGKKGRGVQNGEQRKEYRERRGRGAILVPFTKNRKLGVTPEELFLGPTGTPYHL